jgi:outer membrane receptor for ferrienterochelin and colicin
MRSSNLVRIVAIVAPTLVLPATSWAQPAAPDDAGDVQNISNISEINDVRELSLEALLNSEIDVATLKAQPTRETAGIVTMITREEIINSGARDLVDVLAMVPGFAFAVDVQGTVDIGVRGNWGHEGKTLLLVDGLEMNELLYSTNALGNHYPVDQIERVEVIRGPGSAIYGGFAELAVINIITRGAAELNGGAATITYGQMEHGLGQRTVSLSYGEQYHSGLSLAISGYLGQGNRSDATYTDFTGKTFSSADNSADSPRLLNVALGYRGLKLHLLYDDYEFGGQDGYGAVEPGTLNANFRSIISDARYELTLSDKLTVIPRLDFKYQTPWHYDADITRDVFFDKSVSRLLGGVLASYDAREGLNLIAGTEGYYDHAALIDPSRIGGQTLYGDKFSVSYENIAGYAQALYKSSLANFTAGARYEYHSHFGGSFVPRAAITKVMGAFHAKLLASQAFRAPGIENINLNDGIRPERTNVFEAELGYKLTDHLFVAANAYDITIKKPIIYDYDPTAMKEIYLNGDKTGTRGVEAELKVRYPWGYATANYSYYTAAGKNDVTVYQVPTDDKVMLAFPAHKVTVNANLDVWRTLSLNASLIGMSKRWGYVRGDDMGNPVLGTVPAALLVNTYLLYRNLGWKGLDVGVGAFNVLGEHVPYLQPYNGGHAPLPGSSREILGRVTYTLELK